MEVISVNKKYVKLIEFIHHGNRENAVKRAIELLDKKEITIIDLYETVLTPALYAIDCAEGDKECIWKEHISSSIVRTILELTYPYILKEKQETLKEKVLVVCPTEEYHELGAKMAHDFFLLEGFDSTFIGANTPLQVILDACEFVKPDYIAISVTNYYHIIDAKKVIDEIKKNYPNIKILAGGQAFNDPKALEIVNADYRLTSYQSIKEMK